MERFWYGGDYNPEQWPEGIWAEDMRLFHLAHVNTVTLNVFSWAALQPSENTYDFSRLDKLMELARSNGLNVILATSTAAHPAWMAKRHPDILRVDEAGRRRRFGGRQNACPHSPTYRKYAPLLARKLAERYGGMENLVAWHISNEYGGACYCENCTLAFRRWLRDKYGTLDELNRCWATAFWGHTFYAWDEIVAPDLLSELLPDGRSVFQTISLDYKRFMSDSLLACCALEIGEIQSVAPGIPVTTNFMGFYEGLDYRKWAKALDVVSWDSYPLWDDPPYRTAMAHDLMRSVDGKPFLLMEQTPSVSNWQPYHVLKRPGVLRLQSWQAVAHGADSVLFFQLRQSVGNCEKLHSALISHAGTERTRVFREAAALGAELERVGARLKGAVTRAEAAILFDWDNWWALKLSAGPSVALDVLRETERWYKAFHARNVPVDIIGSHDSLERYRLIVAPLQYMADRRLAEALQSNVEHGGTFVAGCFSGIVDEHDLIVTGGYPGELRKLLGVWIEEFDALPPERENSFVWQDERYPAKLLCALAHTEDAETLASYEQDFYVGMPVLTQRRLGAGSAYYLATISDDRFYGAVVKTLCEESGVLPLAEPHTGIEVTARYAEDKKYIFLLNHTDTEQTIPCQEVGMGLLGQTNYRAGAHITLPPKGVEIIASERS